MAVFSPVPFGAARNSVMDRPSRNRSSVLFGMIAVIVPLTMEI
jgi:hypothetical protein